MSREQSPGSRREFFGRVRAMDAGAFATVRPRAVRGSRADSQVSFALIGCGGRDDAGIVVKDGRARITVLCDALENRTGNCDSRAHRALYR